MTRRKDPFSEDDDEVLKTFASALTGAIRGFDGEGSVEIMTQVREHFEGLFDAISGQRCALEDVTSRLYAMFDETAVVHRMAAREPASSGFFARTHQVAADIVLPFMNSYGRIAAEYDLCVKGKLSGQKRSARRDDFGTISAEARAASKGVALLSQALQLYVAQKTELPIMLKGLRDSFFSYDRYLRKRFIKSESDEVTQPKDIIDLIRQFSDEEPPMGRYVKVKLRDGNPVLTDVLLQLLDALPEYKDGLAAKKGKTGKARRDRVLSQFSIDDATEKLSALSDKKLLNYIEHPQQFFKELGAVLSDFCRAMRKFDPHYQRLLKSPFVQLALSDGTSMREFLQQDPVKIENELEHELARIIRMDLDRIVQREDDVLPDNRREKELFALRESFFDLVHSGLYDLADLGDFDQKYAKAQEIVRQGAALKDEIKEASMLHSARRLRQDRDSDNEFYVGRQRGFGEFYFKREPTPHVKLDSVIGASFDRAKKHLAEIVQTGAVSRVMSLSAPGRKVRSNMILIGPYGCGKTELARAICGDKRVIGASVSVTSTLTAFMHESVNNVKRTYDAAVELRRQANESKPVVLVLDEFDGWFYQEGPGATNTDMAQIENVLLEVLDGIEDYNGIITLAMTNKPGMIPKGILRRFRYVDIVGELTQEERATLLKMYLGKSLPLHDDVSSKYPEWAERLHDAPGDVVRKVVDEVHFALLPPFIAAHPKEARRLEQLLVRRERNSGTLDDPDVEYLKGRLAAYGVLVTLEHVDSAIDSLLRQPPIKMQINAAKALYREARNILDDLESPHQFGLKGRRTLFDV